MSYLGSPGEVNNALSNLTGTAHGINEALWMANYGYRTAGQLMDAVYNGTLDPYQAYLISSQSSGLQLNEQQLDALKQYMAKWQAEHGLLNDAAQLQALGLNASGVLQTGGTTAQTGFDNPMSRVNDRRNQLAQSLIKMAGSMASAGIHGAALGTVRNLAGQTAQRYANSAYYHFK